MTDEHGWPPIRFVDAEKVNPFQVLLELHDHAIGRPATPSWHDVLAELALAAAVVSWWSRWQPIPSTQRYAPGRTSRTSPPPPGWTRRTWSGSGCDGPTSRPG